jgi:hypothetical protein
MESKSSLGKTNKYSNVVKTVQGAKIQQDEPKITKEEVINAFQSFGFTPNERNHDDITYWTTKGQSEKSKMIDELHKRRVEINNKEDEIERDIQNRKKEEENKENQNKEMKSALPRLSDENINALFDEYGLPSPDPEWARSHLPNDPKKIRSILELQRKTADDMLKKQAKNSVNSMPEIPKSQNMPMQQTGAPMMGMGGPTPQSPMGIQGDMMGGDQPQTPFFIGDHAVVRITNQNNPNNSTIWLVDVKKKVLRPFMSEKAFANAFEDPEEAEKSVITISTKELGPGGVLDGFKPLQSQQGVNNDGSMEPIEFSPAQLQRRYGKQSNPEAENRSLSMLDGILGTIGNNQEPQTPQIPQ